MSCTMLIRADGSSATGCGGTGDAAEPDCKSLTLPTLQAPLLAPLPGAGVGDRAGDEAVWSAPTLQALGVVATLFFFANQ